MEKVRIGTPRISRGIALEIVDDLQSRRIARYSGVEPKQRQCRVTLGRMQMEPIEVLAPAHADLIALL